MEEIFKALTSVPVIMMMFFAITAFFSEVAKDSYLGYSKSSIVR